MTEKFEKSRLDILENKMDRGEVKMSVETMIVQCPKCLKKKTINKTNKNTQVRCSVRESGCGVKYYTNKNTVLKIKTNNNKLLGKPSMSIGALRSMYRQIFYKDPPHNSEWNKKKISDTIIVELEKI